MNKEGQYGGSCVAHICPFGSWQEGGGLTRGFGRFGRVVQCEQLAGCFEYLYDVKR